MIELECSLSARIAADMPNCCCSRSERPCAAHAPWGAGGDAAGRNRTTVGDRSLEKCPGALSAASGPGGRQPGSRHVYLQPR